MKKRSISDKLLEMLKTGIFRPITDIVKVDPYLDMELRGCDGVTIYYRGGKILTIKDPLYNQNATEFELLSGLDPKYSNEKKNKQEIPVPHISDMLSYFAKAKHVVDMYEENVVKHLGEKEIQQRIVYENNLSVNSKDTEYFIADIEWEDTDLLGGRADIVAFRRARSKKRNKKQLELTLIEVKQGAGSIRGKNGLKKHFNDFCSFRSNNEYVKEVSADMFEVLKQKTSLGLIKELSTLFIEGDTTITPDIIMPKPVFVFLLANYHHYSKQLRNECQQLPDESKFFLSSLMGYGLYKHFILSKKELIEKWPFIFE